MRVAGCELRFFKRVPRRGQIFEVTKVYPTGKNHTKIWSNKSTMRPFPIYVGKKIVWPHFPISLNSTTVEGEQDTS